MLSPERDNKIGEEQVPTQVEIDAEKQARFVNEEQILTQEEFGAEWEELTDEDIAEVMEDPVSAEAGRKIDKNIAELEDNFDEIQRREIDKMTEISEAKAGTGQEDIDRFFEEAVQEVKKYQEKMIAPFNKMDLPQVVVSGKAQDQLIKGAEAVLVFQQKKQEQFWNEMFVAPLRESEILTVKEEDILTKQETRKRASKGEKVLKPKEALVNKEVVSKEKESYEEIGRRRVKSVVEIGKKVLGETAERAKGFWGSLRKAASSFGGVLGRLGYSGFGFVTEVPGAGLRETGKGIVKATEKSVEMSVAVAKEIELELIAGKKAIEERRKKAETEKRGIELAKLHVEIPSLERKLQEMRNRNSELRTLLLAT